MSDPRRLLDRHLHDDLAELLRTAEQDAPSAVDENKRRIYAAARLPLRSARLAASPAPPLRNVAWVGLAVALAAGVAVNLLRETPSTGGVTQAGHPGVANAEAPSAVPATETTIAIPSLRVDELPAASSSAARSPSSRPPSPEAALEDELQNIYAAQAALTANRPAVTLDLIARYRSRFRAPHFGDEADALEVQALMALGRRDEATAKAERFLVTYPGSPYAQRVRSAAGLNGRAGEH